MTNEMSNEYTENNGKISKLVAGAHQNVGAQTP
jgi:hypothetical protein